MGEARKREEEKDLINVLGYGEGKVSNMAYYVKKIVPIKGGSPTLIKKCFFSNLSIYFMSFICYSYKRESRAQKDLNGLSFGGGSF